MLLQQILCIVRTEKRVSIVILTWTGMIAPNN